MSMVIPSSDLRAWLDLMDALCQLAATDASNGIILNPESIIPADFPELRFENNKYITTSPEYPDIEIIRVILMTRYDEQRKKALAARGAGL